MNKATILVNKNLSLKEKFKKIFNCKFAYYLPSQREANIVLKKMKSKNEVVDLLKEPFFSFAGLRESIKEFKKQKRGILIIYNTFSPFQVYPFEWIGDYALFPLKGFISGDKGSRGHILLSKEQPFNIETNFPGIKGIETVEARRRLAEQTTLHLVRKIDGFKSLFKEIYYPYLTDKENAKSFLKSSGNVFSIRFKTKDIAERFKQKLQLFDRDFVYGKNNSCVKRVRNCLIFSIGLESVNDLEQDIREANLKIK